MFYSPGSDFLSHTTTETLGLWWQNLIIETALCFCSMFWVLCLLVEVIICESVCASPQASQQSTPQAVWVVPALRQLHEITRSFIKQTYQKQDKVTQTQTRKQTHHQKLPSLQSVQCCYGNLYRSPCRASSRTWKKTLRSLSWSRDPSCVAIDWLWLQGETAASQAQLWWTDDTPTKRFACSCIFYVGTFPWDKEPRKILSFHRRDQRLDCEGLIGILLC